MATHNIMIDEYSLREHPDGLVLLLHLPWYRSLWLSCVDRLALRIDGEEIAADRLRVELNGRSFDVRELREQTDELWFVQDTAGLVVTRDTPVRRGDRLDVSIEADLTLVYMQIAPETYVPNPVRMTRTLVANGSDDPVAAQPTIEAEVVESVPPQEGEPFKLGITLYSATSELNAGQYDLDLLLARVDELGVGPGVEIESPQMVPTWPNVSDAFAEQWHGAMEKYDFTPTSFGAKLDMGRLRTRDMTLEEEVEFTEPQLRGAHRLGFPIVRIQSARKELIERILPLAEELDLTLGYEIHAPEGPNTDKILAVRETYDQLESPRLGFVADFSSTMHSMSPTILRTMGRMGLDDDALGELQRIWATDEPGRVRMEEFLAYLGSRGIDPTPLGSFSRLAFNMHGHVDVEEWGDIMHQIVHVHAKFYDIDEHGEEPAIDYPHITRVFVRGGYRGWFSSEWEGHAFADVGEVDPIAMVKRQHNLIRRAMQEELAS